MAEKKRMPVSSSRRKANRRKRLIKIWIRRIVFILVVALLCTGIVLLARKLLHKEPEKTSAYGLPDYVQEEYLTVNKYSRPKIKLLRVNDIVIHYVGNPGTSAAANRSYFDGLASQNDSGSPTFASSNFIVGLDGEVIACVPIDEVAYASNNRNSDSISIEVCHPDETGEFSEATYESLVKLTAWLCEKYSLDQAHIIRHYDITGKLCPLYYVEHEDAWEQFRSDVQSFMDGTDTETAEIAG